MDGAYEPLERDGSSPPPRARSRLLATPSTPAGAAARTTSARADAPAPEPEPGSYEPLSARADGLDIEHGSLAYAVTNLGGEAPPLDAALEELQRSQAVEEEAAAELAALAQEATKLVTPVKSARSRAGATSPDQVPAPVWGHGFRQWWCGDSASARWARLVGQLTKLAGGSVFCAVLGLTATCSTTAPALQIPAAMLSGGAAIFWIAIVFVGSENVKLVRPAPRAGEAPPVCRCCETWQPPSTACEGEGSPLSRISNSSFDGNSRHLLRPASLRRLKKLVSVCALMAAAVAVYFALLGWGTALLLLQPPGSANVTASAPREAVLQLYPDVPECVSAETFQLLASLNLVLHTLAGVLAVLEIVLFLFSIVCASTLVEDAVLDCSVAIRRLPSELDGDAKRQWRMVETAQEAASFSPEQWEGEVVLPIMRLTRLTLPSLSACKPHDHC